jgi:phage baseplate assembly protein W
MIGYSPKFPLQVDKLVGAYAVTTTIQEVAKQNFINLILTASGERIMDINFGVGLRHYLFEPNTPTLTQEISMKITSQTEHYLPYIQINSIDYGTSSPAVGNYDGAQILNIKINFSVPSMGISAESLLIGAGNENL